MSANLPILGLHPDVAAPNAHVHPLFRSILNTHAALPVLADLEQQLAAARKRVIPQDAYGDHEEATRYHDAFMEVARLECLVAHYAGMAAEVA